MRIYSIVKNGKRVDIPQEEFKKLIEKADTELSKKDTKK